MKGRLFAIFFLCVYILVLARPLLPLLDYAVNKDFIAKNLCENRKKPKMNCNGKCHLMKQLKKASNDTFPAQNNASKNSSQEENITHLAPYFNFDATLIETSFDKNYLTYSTFLPKEDHSDIFHPPQL